MPALLLMASLAPVSCIVPSARTLPEEGGSTAYLRSFADATELGAYLRRGSDAGPLVAAHRGGATGGWPENALETFANTINDTPALLEVDVRGTADGRLVLIHDDSLSRTTSGDGIVAARTLPELRNLTLRAPDGSDTPYAIPTLEEALAWADGRAVLSLDLKDTADPAAVLEIIDRHGAGDRVIVITYDLDTYRSLYARAPDLVYAVPASTAAEVEALFAAETDLTRVVGWGGDDSVNDTVASALHERGIRLMLGTYETVDLQDARSARIAYGSLVAGGADIIATDRAALAARAIRESED